MLLHLPQPGQVLKDKDVSHFPVLGVLQGGDREPQYEMRSVFSCEAGFPAVETQPVFAFAGIAPYRAAPSQKPGEQGIDSLLIHLLEFVPRDFLGHPVEGGDPPLAVHGDQSAHHVLNDVLVETLQLAVVDDSFLDFLLFAAHLFR